MLDGDATRRDASVGKMEKRTFFPSTYTLKCRKKTRRAASNRAIVMHTKKKWLRCSVTECYIYETKAVHITYAYAYVQQYVYVRIRLSFFAHTDLKLSLLAEHGQSGGKCLGDSIDLSKGVTE